MQKEFSIKVPDELYLGTYTSNTWVTWTYNGPNTFNVAVHAGSDVIGFTDEEVTSYGPEDNATYFVVEVDANEYPAAAYYMQTFKDEHVYEYEDVENHDGSIYKKITNPRIQDYYSLSYNFGGSNTREDATTTGPWRFVPRSVDTRTLGEIETQAALDSLRSKLGSVALEPAHQELYDNYVLEAEAYLEEMEPIYPWKYVTITTPIAPKVPIVLLKLIKELEL